jgi:hypothetical protein
VRNTTKNSKENFLTFCSNLSNNKVTGVFVTNASVSNFCMLDATFLDCNKKPSQCSCSGRSEPQNDECDNRFIVSTGSTDVATVNSSCSSCYADSPCEIFNDVWFEWRATCTGQATIDACNLAPANTRLGVYRGVCPAINTGTLTTEPDSLDCDDFGGCGGSTGDRQERATIVVSSGESIVVRIGAASPSTFLTAGNFSISCSGTSVLLPTTTPTTTTSEIPALVSPSVNVGAMVGGVLGGLAALLFVVGLAVWVVRRNRNRTSIDENELHNLEHVADGAFGKVYKAYRKDEWVAVKTVNHDALGRDEDILNEVAVLKKIGTHNHIVAFRGFTTVNGQPALVLKFYDAGSLLSKLTNARNADWPKERQLKVASGIAAGVAYLHRNGIIHRDLAARNVLLTSDDVARVTDFGLSLKSSALEMKASSPAGAVSWMAPEQLIKDDKGQYTFSTKSDVYSFGVVLFELFERKAPWSECESRAEIVNKLQSGETLKTNDRKYPSDVIAIVKTCWLVASERDDMATVEIELTKLYKAAANPALYVDNDAPHPAKAEYFDGAGVPVESSTESN